MHRSASLLFILTALSACAQKVDGLAHVAYRVADLDRSVAFYRGLGFEQPFDMKDDGKVTVTFFKINDRQFIELYPAKPGEKPGFMHTCFDAPDLAALHGAYDGRGLKPSPVRKARAGNLLISFPDPAGNVVEFVQYLPGSLHSEDRGKHLGPRRPTSSLVRAVVSMPDPAPGQAFYDGFLGAASHTLATSRDANQLVLALDDPTRAAYKVTDPDGLVLSFIGKPASVADRLITTPVESYPFNWGEGVQMMGLMKYARSTKDARYTGYVERWAQLYPERDLNKLLHAVRRGYCGHWSPASAILYLHAERDKPEYLSLASAVAAFINKDAERSPEGALGHFEGSHQLWVDTLFMACPLLSSLGQANAAATQILLHAKHLQDPKTGLFYHMWDWQTGKASDGFWGRGNGWVLMSLADTLEALPKQDPQYAKLVSVARNLARGLKSTQNAGGVWHTVLDDQSTYEEASATAMFAYGLLKLARLGVLPASVKPAANKAWRAMNEKYVKDGLVLGVSAGTDPRGRDAYRSIALGSQTWGTGAYLLAATEIR